MIKLPISVLVLTYNEEKNIEDCLLSVRDWVKEIFIVDSGSTDGTLNIAHRYTKNIYHHRFENFARQRNWAQDNLPISNKWIFHIDADERAGEGLALELSKMLATYTDIDGIMIPRKTVFAGKWIRHGGHYPVYHLRVFKKNKGRSEERFYDQNYYVKGKTIKIEKHIVNIIDGDIVPWIAKHRKWSYMEAQEVLFNKNRIVQTKLSGTPIERKNWLRYYIYYRCPLFIRGILYFLYRFIVRLGFLDGKQGIIFHFWQGLWYRLLVDLRILEIKMKGFREQQHK